MADLFTLFDGSMTAGGSASVSRQSADSFSDVQSENEFIASLASGSDSVGLLIDYSDFSNFVTFNSAESYVIVTADQILNSYPRDGGVDDVHTFRSSLDGYQRYFLSGWPSWSGHLRLSSGSFVRIDDIGVQDGAARTSFISPGTGSLSIEGWIDVPTLTGSEISCIFQKSRGGDSMTVFGSGSSIYFRVSSGSSVASVSAPLVGMPMFFSAVLDRGSTPNSLRLYTGTTGSFPSLASSSSISLGARYDLASGSFYFGSGSVSGMTSRQFSGSMDALAVWSVARSVVDLIPSYNRRVFAQPGLIGLWNFNDASPRTPSSYASVVRDSSGHRLDGRIQSFRSSIIGSGSIVLDSCDPILSLDDPDVMNYVVSAQVTGSLHDRNNQSLIFNLFPGSFDGPDQASSDVFRNFALILARHFDNVKSYVNQLVNLRRVHYGDFDQTPDELLSHVASSFGWELEGGFVKSDALQYFVGRNVLAGPAGNSGKALADIKAKLWRRILLNLMYLYKTKGTRESVDALLRSYGVDSGFVRLKEYARRTESNLILERVTAEKSFYALSFSSGSRVSYP